MTVLRIIYPAGKMAALFDKRPRSMPDNLWKWSVTYLFNTKCFRYHTTKYGEPPWSTAKYGYL